MTAGRDRPGDDPPTFAMTLEGRATFLDDSAGFVANRKAARGPVLPLQDMDVRSADGGRGHPDQRVPRTHFRRWLVVEPDAVWLHEHRGFII